MSIHHFHYNFREELTKKLKEHYSEDISKYRHEMTRVQQIDEAEQLILDYFERLAADLEEVLAVSDGEVGLEGPEGDTIVRFSIRENFIRFTRRDKFIEVKVGKYDDVDDMVESTILGYVVAGEKKAQTRRIGKVHGGASFDENTMNQYMREAFGNLFKEFRVEEELLKEEALKE
ncbi:hypothetical protein [Acidaminobacter hydrogenoformans]|uniref:Uncharacterized protein n=1 Tax=Acidaminobacter hydrogenoformans DSM 2784 TaxID=1120920 RepID=A0A1G5RU40_9FIRM|nr:hypothetical protein [Acidaminobacter hydrogenoformans]SCZ77645.1 hypothetical protein SAMN03080599_00843 [Acidaminobacter hydrogenoformans DSM 2784]